MGRRRVFVGTNVIIESFRTRCWTAVCRHNAIETVEKCVEEAMTGDTTRARRVQVDAGILNAGLAARHAVGKLDIASFVVVFPQALGLDAGELQLLAHLHAGSTGTSQDHAVDG